VVLWIVCHLHRPSFFLRRARLAFSHDDASISLNGPPVARHAVTGFFNNHSHVPLIFLFVFRHPHFFVLMFLFTAHFSCPYPSFCPFTLSLINVPRTSPPRSGYPSPFCLWIFPFTTRRPPKRLYSEHRAWPPYYLLPRRVMCSGTTVRTATVSHFFSLFTVASPHPAIWVSFF